MHRALEELVWRRAQARCEYCQLPQSYSELTFEIDHIIAKKHLGKTIASNLALSCFYCNSFKGCNVGGIDTLTGKLTKLFHPRKHSWPRHFDWDGPFLVGRTAVGRTTIEVLLINWELRVEHRQILIEAAVFPPSLSL